MAIGGTLGGVAGGLLGGPVGAAIGTGLGSMLEAGIANYPALRKTESEKLNEKRLAELRRQQELGALGLTESERQALFGQQQAQIQNIIDQSQAGIRSAGAAGMQTGAGVEQARMVAQQEKEAQALSEAARQTELKNLERKRELEEEVFSRTGLADEYKKVRQEAISDILSAGLSGGTERFAAEKTIQGPKPTQLQLDQLAKTYNVTPEQAEQFLNLMNQQKLSPEMISFMGFMSGGQ